MSCIIKETVHDRARAIAGLRMHDSIYEKGIEASKQPINFS